MVRHWSSDIIGVLKGAQIVGNALLKHQKETIKQIADNSSIKSVAETNLKDAVEKLKEIDPSKLPVSFILYFFNYNYYLIIIKITSNSFQIKITNLNVANIKQI